MHEEKKYVVATAADAVVIVVIITGVNLLSEFLRNGVLKEFDYLESYKAESKVIWGSFSWRICLCRPKRHGSSKFCRLSLFFRFLVKISIVFFAARADAAAVAVADTCHAGRRLRRAGVSA